MKIAYDHDVEGPAGSRQVYFRITGNADQAVDVSLTSRQLQSAIQNANINGIQAMNTVFQSKTQTPMKNSSPCRQANRPSVEYSGDSTTFFDEFIFARTYWKNSLFVTCDAAGTVPSVNSSIPLYHDSSIVQENIEGFHGWFFGQKSRFFYSLVLSHSAKRIRTVQTLQQVIPNAKAQFAIFFVK